MPNRNKKKGFQQQKKQQSQQQQNGSETTSILKNTQNNVEDEQVKDKFISQFLELNNIQTSSSDAASAAKTTSTRISRESILSTSTPSSSIAPARRRRENVTSSSSSSDFHLPPHLQQFLDHFDSSLNSSSLSSSSNSKNPLVGPTSDKLRRTIWPMVLRQAADDASTTHHQQENEKKNKKNKKNSGNKNNENDDDDHDDRSTTTTTMRKRKGKGEHDDGVADDSATSSSLVTTRKLMSIEECQMRLEAYKQKQKDEKSSSNRNRRQENNDQENSNNDKECDEDNFPFPSRCSVNVIEADINRSLFDFPASRDKIQSEQEHNHHHKHDNKNDNNNDEKHSEAEINMKNNKIDLRAILRGILKRTILRVCTAEPTLHYYQGLHDIASVILHVYFDHRLESLVTAAIAEGYYSSSSSSSSGHDDADDDFQSGIPSIKSFHALEDRFAETFHELARSRLRRFCGSSMLDTAQLLMAGHGVLQRVSPRLATLLERNGIAPTWNFALSWLITWFGHDLDHHLVVPTPTAPSSSNGVEDDDDKNGMNHKKSLHQTTNSVLRVIFDFLIRTNENMIVFLCISILVHFCRLPDGDDVDSGKKQDDQQDDHNSGGLWKSKKKNKNKKTKTDKNTTSNSYDDHLYGKLLPNIPPLDHYSLHDFGMMHTYLKKLPNTKLLCDGDEKKALEQLDVIIDTATRIERVQRELLVYFLEDPMNRVVVKLPDLEYDENNNNNIHNQQGDVMNLDESDHDNKNNNDSSSPPSSPPSSRRDRILTGVKYVVLFGIVASAAAVQVFLNAGETAQKLGGY